MQIYRHLDWISITVPDGTNWRQFLPLDWALDGPGRHGYKRHYTDKLSGATAEADSTQAGMGTHFTLAGGALAELRALDKLTDIGLSEQIALFAAQVSRIDLTIDVWNCGFTPFILSEDLKHKRAKIRARIWRLIEGHNKGVDGDTLDTGSGTSDKRLRVYDKRAELRHVKDQTSWMRLELQLRRKYAHAAACSCAENGVEPTITGHMADYLKWGNAEYTQVLLADSAPPVTMRRKEANRRTWLKGQVARALAAEIVHDETFKGEFDQMVNCWIEQLTKRLTNGV